MNIINLKNIIYKMLINYKKDNYKSQCNYLYKQRISMILWKNMITNKNNKILWQNFKIISIKIKLSNKNNQISNLTNIHQFKIK